MACAFFGYLWYCSRFIRPFSLPFTLPIRKYFSNVFVFSSREFSSISNLIDRIIWIWSIRVNWVYRATVVLVLLQYVISDSSVQKPLSEGTLD